MGPFIGQAGREEGEKGSGSRKGGKRERELGSSWQGEKQCDLKVKEKK